MEIEIDETEREILCKILRQTPSQSCKICWPSPPGISPSHQWAWDPWRARWSPPSCDVGPLLWSPQPSLHHPHPVIRSHSTPVFLISYTGKCFFQEMISKQHLPQHQGHLCHYGFHLLHHLSHSLCPSFGSSFPFLFSQIHCHSLHQQDRREEVNKWAIEFSSWSYHHGIGQKIRVFDYH